MTGPTQTGGDASAGSTDSAAQPPGRSGQSRCVTAGAVRASEPDDWGVVVDWVDANQQPQSVSAATVEALRKVIGRPPADLESRAPIVSRPGRDLGLGSVEVDCEDGQVRRADGVLPADFPLGYHRLRTPQGHQRRLIVSPGRCWLPDGWRAWGWGVQLYAARSRHSWGIGDLADLRSLREWADQLGAGFLMLNPLHAAAPTPQQQASPYLPVTRRFRSPLYLRVEEVPGADRVDLASLAERGRALNAEALIDRDAVWALKREALERIFEEGAISSHFSGWRARQGKPLQDFATWCALTEVHGPDWRTWKASLQHPDNATVTGFAAKSQERVTFHAWLQWLLDVQLKEASGDLAVIQDLPIGVDGGGADAWAWQEQLADGAHVGVPPDFFNSAGQDWGSPPLVPWRLREDGYQAFVESIRATMAGGGGLRIDHVMGLFRLWWVPVGATPPDGAYVRFPSDDLLDIVALESSRARAVVVGEDLGTVEPGVREALAEHGMLSYRLLWFEERKPVAWPEQSMAAVTTHDLPTVAGLWTGADLAEQRSYLRDRGAELERGREQLLERLSAATGLLPSAEPEQAVLAAHRLLAEAPSTLLCATLEDAVLAEQRPNLPGVPERPNWCLPLPLTIEELVESPHARSVAQSLGAAASRITKSP